MLINLIIKKSDSALKKLSAGVNNLTSGKDFREFINSINSIQKQYFNAGKLIGNVYDFNFIQ